MDESVRIYIGTLFSGENELEACRESVKRQTCPYITHEIFSHLPNKEAHETLYARFMELQGQFDYFIKLDADMVLVHESVIEEMVALFRSHDRLDHGVFTVQDWYSGTPIKGLHMFTPRVTWKRSRENLFVDEAPMREGEKHFFSGPPSPVAYHSPDPSLEEAFLFGFHRGLKVMQRGRWIKSASQARRHLRLLQRAWGVLQEDHDTRRVAVILGANQAFEGEESALVKKDTDLARAQLESLVACDIESFIRAQRKSWDQASPAWRGRELRYVHLRKLYPLW